MGLFTFLKNMFHTPKPNLTDRQKADLQAAIDYEKASPNPKFHRTEKEEDLSFRFSERNYEKITKLENKIYEAAAAVDGCGTIRQQIKKCDTAIKAYERLKAFCYKTKGGTIYFQDMWEFCHNSKNPCFSYIDDIKATKEKLEATLEEAKRGK